MTDKTETAAAGPALRLPSLLLAAGVFVADRLTKLLIESRMGLHETKVVIPGFFHITHVRNQGIAFGLFADSPSAWKTLLLVALSAAVLGAVAYVLWTSSASAGWQNAGLALILGGAAGNLFDRATSFGVVDFLDFFVGEWHWPAFNLADSAIVAGGGLLILDLIRAERRGRK